MNCSELIPACAAGRFRERNVAHLMLGEVEKTSHVHQIVGVSRRSMRRRRLGVLEVCARHAPRTHCDRRRLETMG